MEKVPGKQLFGTRDTLSEDTKAQIYSEHITAIRVMRPISVLLWDAGMYNILYDCDKARLAFHDFEGPVDLDPSAPYPFLEPALGVIFWRYKPDSIA